MTTTPSPRPAGSSPGGAPSGPAASFDWRRRARTTALWSGGVGLAVLAATALLVLSWTDDLPDPVATHWSAGSGPDGFSSLGAYVTTFVVLGVVCVVGFAAMAWSWGRAASTRRVAAASAVWIACFSAVVLVGSLSGQRGIADAHDAPGVGGIITLAWLAPLVPALVAAALVRPDPALPARDDVAPDAPHLALGAGERAAWVGRATGGPLPVVVAVLTAALVAISVVLSEWAVLVVAAVVALGLLTITAFRVRVSVAGLDVRSVFGWPRTSIPADEVERADAVEVRAVREFGGYGWRLGRRGRTGVVVRSGEALEVTRTGGRRFVVTVDDALDAAALLNTLAQRARTGIQ